MTPRPLRALLTATITAIFALFVGPTSQAQLHDVLVEPSNAVYSSTVEIHDGTEHMLIASTVDDAGANPEVRISRVKTDGSIEWESDYQSTNGWRASHVLTVGDDTGVLIGVVEGGTGGGPASSMLMSFDLTTGTTIGIAEIQEAGPNADKGLVLTHGIHANGLLVLTGWLGGYTGLQLNEDRVSVLLGVEVPDGNQSSLNPNWIHALNTNGPIDGPDYDMGSHVVEVSQIGYLMSGSGNAFAQTPVNSGYHQAPLASLVDYDGTELWSKVTPYWFPGEGVDNQPIVPIADRHAVASCATPLYASAANSDNIELVQTVNWVHNRGLTTLRYSIDGASIVAKGLRLDGTFNFPSAETSLKGYSMYRALNANSATEVMIAGYVNDPEYLDSDPSTGPKDRVPFLMRVDIDGTSATSYLVGHNIYAGSPSTNYGDDPGIHAGNSQAGQQPIIYHPEMMDLRESALGYGLIGHRRTHDVPVVFDPSIIHVNSAGVDAYSGLFGCEDFTHPMVFEFPAVAPFTPFQETINLIGFPQDVSVHLPSTVPTPCDAYFSCDVVLDVAVMTDTCDHYILTASNLGSTPMSELDLSFDRGLDGIIEQSGTADGSDGSGNPTYEDVYPSGVATSIEVTLNCQGVDYSQVVTLTPDCPDDDEDEEDCELDIAPGIDMWLYCGEGCWGGALGTRAAITFDMSLYSLNESEYDAEVCFSDGTTYPLDLDSPMSLIKCFSGFTFFKRACLKIYEEGGLAAGAEPCYEVCDSESCIAIERLPLDLADVLIPDLTFNASTCSLEAPELPTSIDSRTQIMTFNSAFPGGDDGVAFLSAFMNGDDFAELADYHPVGSTAGDYTATCDFTLQTDITHPILYSTAGANAAEELQTAAALAGPNAIAVAGTPEVELVSAYAPGDTFIPGDMYIPGEMYTPIDSPLSSDLLDASFTDLVPVSSNISGIGYNIWSPSSFSYCIGNGCYNGASSEEGDDENGSSASEEEDCGGVPDVPTGTHYDNGVLGSASFSLSDNTSISVTEAGQICPQNFTYLTEVTLSVFNTTELFEEEEEEFPMGEWTPNDENEEEEFPMSEWTPTTFVGTSILTDAVLQPFESGATVQDLAIDYYDGFGDGSGPWSVTDTEGNIVETGAMPSGATSNSTIISLPPGNYEFVWDVDCYGAYDNSGIQISAGYTPILELTPGGNTPGIIRIPFDVPGILIPTPTPTPVDTTCDAVFSHDFMAPGVLPPSTPGTYIVTEDNIQLGFEMFFDGYGATYGTASVGPALPTVGSGQVLTTSNIMAVYDMSAFPNVNQVSFVFFDGAGIENLQVNGHSLLTGELETMPAAVAPGVTMSVTTTAYPGYQAGTVVLTGNVQKLEIGGQQFFVDHICVKHDGTVIQTPNGGGCTATCDEFTGFETLAAGDRYGDLAAGANISVAPGALAVTSDGVPVFLEPLHDFATSYYKYMAVDAHYGGWGSGMTIWTNNINAKFEIQTVMDVTDTVCIAFRDEGGFENLSINGSTPAVSPNGYGGLTVFNGTVMGGVQVQVIGANVGYAFEGTITLIGDVDKFSIGGQELWLDDLCISGLTSLEDAAAAGDETLQDNLGVSVAEDMSACQFAVSIDPMDGYPPYDNAVLQFVGTQSGIVYNTFPADESGITFVAGPEPTESNETMVLGIELIDNGFSLTLQFDDILITPCYCQGSVNVETTASMHAVDASTWASLNNWTSGTTGFGGFEDAGHISWNTFCTEPPAPGTPAATTFNVEISEVATGPCGPTYQVLFQAYNCCGADDAYILYQVIDNEAPTIELTCPPNAVVSFEDALLSLPDGGCTVAPAVSGDIEVSVSDDVCEGTTGYTDVVVDGDGNPLSDVNCFLGGYSILRTWTATYQDCCGNTASTSCEQLIEVSNTTLGSAALVLGESGLIQLMEYSLNFAATSGNPCDLEFAYDLGDLTNLVSYADVVLTNANGDEEGEATDNGDGTFTLTTSAINALQVSLHLYGTGSNEAIIIDFPDLVVPVCPVVTGCIALAGFVHLDNGDCTSNFVYTGTPGTLVWSVDGVTQGSTGVVYAGSFAPGVYTVCVTVTDFNDPDCTDTFCDVVSVSCGNNSNDECDMEFTHELMAAGNVAAAGAGVTVASEDDIDLSLDNIQYISGATNFGTATVQAAQPEAGDGQVLWLNNIMAVYDVSAAGPVQQVSFDFIDYGGLENLRINGALLVDDIDDMHGANLGGVSVFVAYNTYSGFIAGEVILTGNVQELGVAGQEFYIDNVCVVAGEANGGDCDLECDYTTDFDSDYSGNSWGDPANGASVNVIPGDYAFTSGDVDVYAEVFQPHIGGTGFGPPVYNWMTTETAGVFGLGRILQLNNISARFDIESAVSETDTVCVTFKVEGNNAKVGINNTEYTSEDLDHFLSLDGTGIGGPSGTTVGTIQITGTPESTANGTLVAYTYVMTLIGDVHTLSFGGDEVRVDDVCIVAEGATACADTDADGICDDDEVAGCTDPTAANYNPNATDDDGSCSVPGQNDECDMEFTHEFMSSGDITVAGPGIIVATEDDIDLSLDNIQYISGATNFGTATVQAAQPEAGDGQVLWLNNIMAVYDVSAAGPVQQVSFDFIDYGGLENLRINGALLVDDIDDMHGANLGGVSVFVAYNTYSGFIAGEVILTGNVQELGVAGQEFYIDNVCVVAGEANGGDCDLECDYTTDFDSDYSGNSWGDPAAGASVAVVEYDFAFTSGDIDVYAIPTLHASIAACGDPLYQYMTTETAGTFGVGRVLRLNNIGAQFDIQSAVPETDTVCVAYRYAGNLRGFTLNGTMLCNNNPSMSSLHNMVFGGCLVQVDEVLETTANGSVVAASGVLTIIGDVNNIEFRGDEVWVDDLCISAPEGPANLTDFIEDEGAEVLLAMMNPQIEYDAEGCSLAASLDLSDANLPTADALDLQLVGAETGTVYSSASFTLGDAIFVAGMTEDGVTTASRMPHIITWDGLLLTDIPETNGEMLLVSIALTEGNTFIALGVDGVLVPGCNDAATQGCTYPEAENYDPDADEDDGSCVILGSNPCPTDIDGDGLTSVPDLLLLLGNFSLECTGGDE